MSNQFLNFCPTTTGTNLLTNTEYAAESQRDIGNQPGVARSKLVNKALRQANMITAQLAGVLADTLGVDVLDQDSYETTIFNQMKALTAFLPPVLRPLTAVGAGTFNMSYVFFISTGSATTGATYTNNAVTFTVSATVASLTQVRMTGSGAPAAFGTLTKTSGTGDATLTFYAYRKPVATLVEGVGGGGGGGGVGTGAPIAGGDGGTTSFGTTYLTATGGTGGTTGSGVGGGGTALGGSSTGPSGSILMNGASGQATNNLVASSSGGMGGGSPFGGAGAGGLANANDADAIPFSGSGGGGAPGSNGLFCNGGGGGAGGYFKLLIENPMSSYPYVIGDGGTAGQDFGGIGTSGMILATEQFQ